MLGYIRSNSSHGIFRPERKCEDQLHDLKINVYVGMLISDAYHA